jgi:hypothetical protein
MSYLLKGYKYSIIILSIGLFFISLVGCSEDTNDYDDVPKDYLEYGSVVKDGLIAYYPLDGDANDYSGNEFHGIASNIESTLGRFDQEKGALLFNGEDDYIVITPFKNFNYSSGTICYWARIGANMNNHQSAAVISKIDTVSEGFVISLFGSKDYWFEFKLPNNARFADLMNINNRFEGRYSFIVMTFNYDSNLCKIRHYLEGFLTQEITMNTDVEFSFNNNNQPLYIGKSLLTKYAHLEGELDDILIYNRALSENEILELYEWK